MKMELFYQLNNAFCCAMIDENFDFRYKYDFNWYSDLDAMYCGCPL